MNRFVYIFCGNESAFPAGVFDSEEVAVEWIKKYNLSGTLNEYPVNVGLYDWAIDNEYFTIKNEYQKETNFIQKFTCASINHLHFENGVVV